MSDFPGSGSEETTAERSTAGESQFDQAAYEAEIALGLSQSSLPFGSSSSISKSLTSSLSRFRQRTTSAMSLTRSPHAIWRCCGTRRD